MRGNTRSDLRDLKGVRETRAVEVTVAQRKHLRFRLQPTKRGRMNNPGFVSQKLRFKVFGVGIVKRFSRVASIVALKRFSCEFVVLLCQHGAGLYTHPAQSRSMARAGD